MTLKGLTAAVQSCRDRACLIFFLLALIGSAPGFPGEESIKANNKGFYKYINSKREKSTPLLNGMGHGIW